MYKPLYPVEITACFTEEIPAKWDFLAVQRVFGAWPFDGI
jgi:hypothetical protein